MRFHISAGIAIAMLVTATGCENGQQPQNGDPAGTPPGVQESNPPGLEPTPGPGDNGSPAYQESQERPGANFEQTPPEEPAPGSGARYESSNFGDGDSASVSSNGSFEIDSTEAGEEARFGGPATSTPRVDDDRYADILPQDDTVEDDNFETTIESDVELPELSNELE